MARLRRIHLACDLLENWPDVTCYGQGALLILPDLSTLIANSSCILTFHFTQGPKPAVSGQSGRAISSGGGPAAGGSAAAGASGAGPGAQEVQGLQQRLSELLRINTGLEESKKALEAQAEQLTT